MEEDNILRQQAMLLFDRAFRLQRSGKWADAIIIYRHSIKIFPTAEAYTFLGWTYSQMNRYEEAIEMCHKAIALDPDYGNPYNDIGSYLIEMDKWADAVPWLEKALHAERYTTPHYAHMNLGRIYEHFYEFEEALHCYEAALACEPLYAPASYARTAVLGRLN